MGRGPGWGWILFGSPKPYTANLSNDPLYVRFTTFWVKYILIRVQFQGLGSMWYRPVLIVDTLV